MLRMVVAIVAASGMYVTITVNGMLYWLIHCMLIAGCPPGLAIFCGRGLPQCSHAQPRRKVPQRSKRITWRSKFLVETRTTPMVILLRSFSSRSSPHQRFACDRFSQADLSLFVTQFVLPFAINSRGKYRSCI